MGALFHILKTDPMSQVIPLRCNGALSPARRSPVAATLPLSSVCPELQTSQQPPCSISVAIHGCLKKCVHHTSLFL